MCALPTKSLRVLAWNLRHGGGNVRTPAQAMFLIEQACDVLLLCEVREGRWSQLRSMLIDHGFSHCLTAPASSAAVNRVAILSRLELTHEPEPTWSDRLISSYLPELDIHLVSVHVPDESQPTRRAQLWQDTVREARRLCSQRALIAGDFNTQRRTDAASRPGQTCDHWLGTLATLGFVNLHQPTGTASPQPHAPTWFGPQGETYALDAIWASTALAPRCAHTGCESSCVRDKLSDHAAVWAAFALP